ncbi:hypothetical protein [Fusobacterium gastrosuis]|uniref:hypothetical protein n=1 Tax=Fusobacterium gastrosuis TaxID=1755100 RepID=UPI002971824F|nr:nitrite/sulfite reductase [Fusobacteriaceae bacterium]MDY5712665.1 nitrite/sulfite reductase [Fusobacterium gastrosuis]
MEILEKEFFSIRRKMLANFKEQFEKHLELGEKEIPIKSFGAVNGVYHERGNEVYFIRPRVRAGVLSLKQLKGISDIADQYGDGEIKLTTRHGLQIRGVRKENVYTTLDELAKYGLYTQAVGGKSIRNMVISAYSGFEDEAFDITPYAVRSVNYLFQNEDTYSLPGKLKFAASNKETDEGNAKYSDMGFIAKKIDGENYFEIYFDFGMNLSMKNPYRYSKVIKAEEMVYYLRATVMMFKDNMDMKNPRARLRTMCRMMGVEAFEAKYPQYLQKAREEIDAIIDVKKLYSDIDVKYKEKPWAKKVDFIQRGLTNAEIRNIKECFYQEGIYAVKLKYRGGVIKKGELALLVKYLEKVSHDIKIRLSNNQDIIIFDLSGDEAIDIVKIFNSLLVKTDLEDSITCTGMPRCRLAITSSKITMDNILKYFDKHDTNLKKQLPMIRMSGCPNSCSLIFKGTLGFAGMIKSVDGERKMAYTMISENKNIIHSMKAVIEEENMPKMLFELAQCREKFEKFNTDVKNFDDFVNKNADEVNEIIAKYM